MRSLLLGIATRLAEVVGSILIAMVLADVVALVVATLRVSAQAVQQPVHAASLVRDAGLLAICAFSVWSYRTRGRTGTAVLGDTTAADLRRLLSWHAERSRREDERWTRWVAAIAGVALVAVVGAGVHLRRSLVAPEARQPPNTTLAEGITVGSATAVVRVDLWEDLQSRL